MGIEDTPTPFDAREFKAPRTGTAQEKVKPKVELADMDESDESREKWLERANDDVEWARDVTDLREQIYVQRDQIRHAERTESEPQLDVWDDMYEDFDEILRKQGDSIVDVDGEPVTPDEILGIIQAHVQGRKSIYKGKEMGTIPALRKLPMEGNLRPVTRGLASGLKEFRPDFFGRGETLH